MTNMSGMFRGALSFNADHVNGWYLDALTHNKAEIFFRTFNSYIVNDSE